MIIDSVNKKGDPLRRSGKSVGRPAGMCAGLIPRSLDGYRGGGGGVLSSPRGPSADATFAAT